MINIVLTGVGGQGTVLAAKVLAMTAAAKGWKARTAETIGMAQRGGSVISHVRMANLDEEIHSPLVTKGTADLIIAFEPGEAARVLPYLGVGGTIVTATTPVEPVTAALAAADYDPQKIIDTIQLTLYNDMAKNVVRGPDGRKTTLDGSRRMAKRRLISIDDKTVTDYLGGNRKVLNTVMLAAAIGQNCIPVTADDLRVAISACVKPQYVAMNMNAIDLVLKGIK